jgi:hypothetical protein
LCSCSSSTMILNWRHFCRNYFHITLNLCGTSRYRNSIIGEFDKNVNVTGTLSL